MSNRKRIPSGAIVTPGSEIDVDWQEAIPVIAFTTGTLTDIFEDQETGEQVEVPMIGLWMKGLHGGEVETVMPVEAAHALIAKLQGSLLEHTEEQAQNLIDLGGSIADLLDPDRKHDDG